MGGKDFDPSDSESVGEKIKILEMGGILPDPFFDLVKAWSRRDPDPVLFGDPVIPTGSNIHTPSPSLPR